MNRAPSLLTPRIIGWLGGKPCLEIAGGSVDDSTGQQQQDQGGDDLGDLIDDGGAGGDGTGNDSGAGANDGDAPPAWWATASAALEQRFQSEIDRRINQQGQRRRQQQQQDPSQQGQGQQQQAAPSGVSREDLRDARGAYREAWGEQQLRLLPEEREFVSKALPGLLQAGLAREDDPDLAGATVARQLATDIKALRASHQRQLIRELEQRGALDRSKLKPGRQSDSSGQSKSAGAEFAAGEAKAREIMRLRQPGAVIPGDEKTT